MHSYNILYVNGGNGMPDHSEMLQKLGEIELTAATLQEAKGAIFTAHPVKERFDAVVVQAPEGKERQCVEILELAYRRDPLCKPILLRDPDFTGIYSGGFNKEFAGLPWDISETEFLNKIGTALAELSSEKHAARDALMKMADNGGDALKVLFVEDESIILDNFEYILKQTSGADVIPAQSRRMALAFLAAQQETGVYFDAVVTDYYMDKTYDVRDGQEILGYMYKMNKSCTGILHSGFDISPRLAEELEKNGVLFTGKDDDVLCDMVRKLAIETTERERSSIRVLFADDEVFRYDAFAEELKEIPGVVVHCSEKIDDAVNKIGKAGNKGLPYEIVVCDSMFNGAKFGGLAIIRHAKETNPKCACILVSGLECSRELMENGPADLKILRKPLHPSELSGIVQAKADEIRGAARLMKEPPPKTQARRDARDVVKALEAIIRENPLHIESGTLRDKKYMLKQRLLAYSLDLPIRQRQTVEKYIRALAAK